MATFNELKITSFKSYRKILKFLEVVNFIIDEVKKADRLPILIPKKKLEEKFNNKYRNLYYIVKTADFMLRAYNLYVKLGDPIIIDVREGKTFDKNKEPEISEYNNVVYENECGMSKLRDYVLGLVKNAETFPIYLNLNELTEKFKIKYYSILMYMCIIQKVLSVYDFDSFFPNPNEFLIYKKNLKVKKETP